MTDTRIVFAGTPEFAAVALRALVESGQPPIAVLTQPDRPAGRGKQLQASPVKSCALSEGIDVLQPATLRDADAVAQLKALRPDIMIVAAYGLLLPQAVLDIPAQGCLNIHASLLPRWRGAAPIQAALLAGDAQSGVCLMAMTAGLDTGPVYAATAIDIGASDTAGALHDRLADAGGRLLVEKLAAIVAGETVAVAQDDTHATYAPKIKTADAELDWQDDAVDLERKVRAYNPVPGAWFMLGDARIKCWRAVATAGGDTGNSPAGTIVAADTDGVVVACGSGALLLQGLQRPGKRPVDARQFAAGLDLVGQRL